MQKVGFIFGNTFVYLVQCIAGMQWFSFKKLIDDELYKTACPDWDNKIASTKILKIMSQDVLSVVEEEDKKKIM